MASRGVLIDTSILVRHLRESGSQRTRFEHAVQSHKACYISAISVFEIEFGAMRAGRPSDLQAILKLVHVLPFDREEAKEAARVHAELVAQNQTIGTRDIFIAGTGLAHQLPILTDNEGHFRRVPGLVLASGSDE